MKLTKSRFRPQYEALEDRLTPSVTNAIFTGGNLTVVGNNAATNISLVATADNTWDLLQGATTIGHYAGVANVNVRLGAGADSVLVNPASFNSGTNFNINTGRGPASGTTRDTVNVNGTGSLAGRVNIVEYSGGNINIGTTASTTINGPVTISGSAGATSTLTIGTGANNGVLGGNLSVSNVQTIAINAASTLNNVSVSNGAGALPTSFTLAATASVAGNLSVTGGSGSDGVSVAGTVAGNLTFSGGTGSNTLTLNGSVLGNVVVNSQRGTSAVNATGGTVGGNFTYYGGNAGNTITTSPASTFNGNVTLGFGNGLNTYEMPAFVIHGNLSVTAGNGTNNLAATFATGASTVDGNITVRFGNGTNFFTASTNLVVHGQTVSYTGGTLADTVVVASAAGSSAYDLNIRTGGGTDSVNLGGLTAVNPVGNLIVTFGLFGTKTYVAPPIGSFATKIITNFP